MHLKGHPLIGYVFEARRRSDFIIGAAQSVLNEPGLLRLAENLKRLKLTVFTATAVIHPRGADLVSILDNNLNVRAGVRRVSGPVALTNDDLFPTIAALVGRFKHFRGKTLPPLHVKLFSSSKLHGIVIREVEPKTAGSVRRRFGRNRKPERAGSRGFHVGVHLGAINAIPSRSEMRLNYILGIKANAANHTGSVASRFVILVRIGPILRLTSGSMKEGQKKRYTT